MVQLVLVAYAMAGIDADSADTEEAMLVKNVTSGGVRAKTAAHVKRSSLT